jgi:hypothetical protein
MFSTSINAAVARERVADLRNEAARSRRSEGAGRKADSGRRAESRRGRAASSADLDPALVYPDEKPVSGVLAHRTAC